ncbi:hypothetical protein [Desulfobacula sp.]
MEHIQLKDEIPNAKEALTGGIVHDFNNLLFEIKDKASLMMNSVKPSDPLYKLIKEIIHCSDKGFAIINLLLGFTKVDEHNISRVDINQLVQNTLENLDVKGKEFVLDVDLDPKALIVKADSDKLNQVLTTIVDNALLA